MLAFGIPGTAEELSEPSLAREHRLSAEGAGDVGGLVLRLYLAFFVLRKILGVLAGRVVRARDEAAVLSPFDDHGFAALLTNEIRRSLLALDVRHVRLCLSELLLEGEIKIVQDVQTLCLSLFDPVKLRLHLRGEGHIQDPGKVLHEEVGHEDTRGRWG